MKHIRPWRKCVHCGQPDETVGFSKVMNCYVCDDCYTDYMDAKEQANIDACYSVGEQDF